MGRSWKHDGARASVLTDPLLRKGHAHPKKKMDIDVCPVCNGKGAIPNTEEECHHCDGEGFVIE